MSIFPKSDNDKRTQTSDTGWQKSAADERDKYRSKVLMMAPFAMKKSKLMKMVAIRTLGVNTMQQQDNMKFLHTERFF